MSSVTRVEVSADLEYAKVYVSVMGSASVQRRTMQGLTSAQGVVQRMVARELAIRHCPHLSFHLDESIKRAAETIRLINETMAELGPGEPPDESRPPNGTDAASGESAGDNA